ncbi:MAG: zinc ribbon domain-containing protein, partial [Anaerolineae bacterium]
MKCTHCRFENPAGFKFCGQCGSPLATTENQLTPADIDRLWRYMP